MLLFNPSIIRIKYQPIGSNNNLCHSLDRIRSAFTSSIRSTTPRLCVIARVYGPQIGYLPVLALSLYHAGLENDRLFIINTDNRTDIPLLIETISLINKLIFRTDYVTFIDLGAHSFEDDYGYGMTDRALSYFYDDHVQSTLNCHYITFTNGDNFYSRSLGSKVLPHMKAGQNIIAWGFVSRHYWPEFKETNDDKSSGIPKIFDDGSNKCINVSLRISRVDLGAVTYRLAFLKQHKLYFHDPDGTYSFVSDGLFITKAAALTNASVVLRQTLFVHQ